MKKVFKMGFFYLVVFAMVLGNSVLSIDFSIPVAQANNDPVTICHATGGGTYNEIHVNENAINGHFENNGTPKSGHEDDLLFEGNVSCPGPEPSCGDGTVNQTREQCDGDAPKVCTTESGYAGTQTCKMPPELTIALVQTVVPIYCVWDTCVSTESCGDGTKNGLEQCDDSNTTNGDGCSATCQTETPEPSCGDGTVNQISEQCDDGNAIVGDGCDTQCQREPEEDCQLTLTKSDEGYEPIAPGAEITYHLTLTNTGTTACEGVWLKDYYDANTSYVSATLTPDINDPGYRVGWWFNTITSGSSEEIDLTMSVSEQTACDSTLTNTAKFKLDSEETWTEITEQTSIVCEQPADYIIKAAKVVCESEEYLPDWGDRDEEVNLTMISATTAADYVAQSNEHCWLEEDWAFEWGINVADPGNDFIGPAGNGWNSFDTTTTLSTMAEASIPYTGASTLMFREVLPVGYLPFAWDQADGGSGTANKISAEIYCYNDVFNYDNYDWINNPEEGGTYYCVAFNVKVQSEYTCGNEVIEGNEECDDGLFGSVTCTAQCEIIEQPPICYVEGEPFFASTVESYDQGQKKDGSNVDANRSVPEQGLVLELGQNVSNFFSLGFGGWTIVSFDNVFVDGPGNDIKITEDTWGGGYPLEKADVYVSQDGTTWAFLGTADNTNLNVIHTTSEFDLATTGLTWGQYIKVVDTTDPSVHSASSDGYDLNAVEALSGGYIGECDEIITVCKMDEQENPLAEWEMTLYGSNLIVNGGFEAPILSSGEWVIYTDATLTSWTVNAGDGLEIQNNAAGSPHGGNQLAELDSNNSSVVSQIITTVPGEEYNFSFWYSPRPNIGSGDNTIGVSVQGIGDSGFLVSDTIGATAVGGANTSWTLYEYSFTATQSSTEIKFADLGTSNSYGGYLDDIVLKQTVSGLTEENGCVEFVNLPYDTYQIMETMKDGWTQITPNDPNYFTVNFNEENNNPKPFTFVNRRNGEPENNIPVITLVGANPVNLIIGGTYTDAGATANDVEDGDITADIVVNNPVNTGVLGTYIITYNVKDSDNNDAVEVTRTVVVGPNGGPTPYCGDGNLNQEDEVCEVGQESQSCTDERGYEGTQTCNLPTEVQSQEVAYCVWNECVSEYFCGDGLLQASVEQCDDGNTADGDNCSSTCQVTTPPCTTNCGGGGGGGGGGSGPSTFSIKNLEAGVSCSGVQLSWLTNRSSDTLLDYGTVSGVYTEHINNDTNATGHELTLAGLLPNTTYYYQVRAISSTGTEIKVVEKSFTTPPAEQCGAVLGEKIENPLICDFIRPSGSHGQDKDVVGVMQFPDGSLLRDACNRSMPVYLIKDQKKWHIPNWKYLHDHYFGQRIYNVLSTVLNNYPVWTPKVLGVKYYADGTLLRGSNMKVYIIEDGKKRHITSLEELLKYAGQEIINVSDDVLNQY